MNNEPQYRDLKLDDEVTFTMKAVDACIFMAWAMQDHVETSAVDHIFSKVFGPQFEYQLFQPASLKAARAEHAQRHEDAIREAQEEISKVFGGLFTSDGPPSLFANGVTVVCDICGARDHYDTLPFGELTCGHDGPRHGIAEA